VWDIPQSEARESASLPHDSSFPESDVEAVTSSQQSEPEYRGRESYREEHAAVASDEDSDSDDANTMSRRRDRFCTERRPSTSATAQSTPASKAEKRDIPDTLGVTCCMLYCRVVSAVTGQLADMPTRLLPTCGLDDSRTGHLTDWTTRGCHRRLCVLSFPFWRHLRDRELSSPRPVQSAS